VSQSGSQAVGDDEVCTDSVLRRSAMLWGSVGWTYQGLRAPALTAHTDDLYYTQGMTTARPLGGHHALHALSFNLHDWLRAAECVPPVFHCVLRGFRI
jgi:hypothetical protein